MDGLLLLAKDDGIAWDYLHPDFHNSIATEHQNNPTSKEDKTQVSHDKCI